MEEEVTINLPTDYRLGIHHRQCSLFHKIIGIDVENETIGEHSSSGTIALTVNEMVITTVAMTLKTGLALHPAIWAVVIIVEAAGPTYAEHRKFRRRACHNNHNASHTFRHHPEVRGDERLQAA